MMNTKTVSLVIGSLVLSAMLAITFKTPRIDTRGFRNNNPGNIRQTQIQWQGEEGPEAVDDDPAFEEFVYIEDGIRAIGVLLDTYRNKHGLNTITKLINRYAPPVENQTDAYALSVARRTGIHQDKILQWPLDRVRIVEAIMYHENGVQPFSFGFIADSLRKTA